MENEFLKSAEKLRNVPGNIYCTDSVESTNAEAKAAECPPDKSVFIAETQKAGRGRMGRAWSSPKGSGIWMSICLKPKCRKEGISLLTLLAGMAVARVVPGTVIKWPNDVLLNNKKLCGVLTEAVTAGGEITRVIIGIGINVNTEKFPPELEATATSIYKETKIRQERIDILEKVLEEFFGMYDEFIENGFAPFYDEYENLCVTLGKEVTIIKNGEKYPAKAIGLTKKGELVIERKGVTSVVNSGEVSVRGIL